MKTGKQWSWFGIVLLSLTLSGCATQLAFRHLDWIVQEYVDDYIDLTGAQEDQLDQQVHQISQWIIYDATPEYIAFLDQLIQTDFKTMTVPELREQKEIARTLFRALVSQIPPHLTGLATTLSDEQAQQLLVSIQERHRKAQEKYQDMALREMHQETETRYIKQFKRWFGNVTPAQKEVINTWVSLRSIDLPGWQAWQQVIESETRHLMQIRHDPEQFQHHLSELFLKVHEFRPPRFQLSVTSNRRLSDFYVVQMLQLMTPAQQQHFKAELKDWKEIVLDIQAQGTPSKPDKVVVSLSSNG